VVLIDGGDPAYVNAGLAQGLLPNFKKFMNGGFVSLALGAMPSFTNPNNVSVITGVPPSVHGISGNFFLNPATGQETMMDQPEFLRADSILAAFSEHGAKVVAITAKNKLARILAYKLQHGITFSSERADKCTKKDNGIDDCLTYVGMPLPDEYSVDLSLFVLEAMGIYGTVSYVAVLRTREVGIRIAVGAQKSDILLLILRESSRPVAAGLGVGILIAIGISYLLRSLFYGLGGIDGVSLAIVTALFVGITLLAAYQPSRRAMRMDPMAALRYE
jgi:ABC-type antimicrobial peptide transport system permease subunit